MKQRIENLQETLADTEAALIFSESSRLYFTGFASSAGAVVITRKRAVFLIDFRYYEKAKKTVNSCETVLSERLYDQLAALFACEKTETVYLETDRIDVKRFFLLREKLAGVTVSADSRIADRIAQLRSLKSESELQKIRAAQRLTDETFSFILPRIESGRSERDIMLDMEFFMRKAGSDGVSFDFIVVSGKNSSLPHGVPTDKRIEPGDFITMDFGAVIDGYRSDMTRTVALGFVSEQQETVYRTVLEAQRLALSAIRPGVRCCEVDRLARDYIADAGFGACFGHGLGHSVGLEIHENPACNTVCQTEMEPGLVMTVEPGIYLPEQFGVRIEDMVFVTESGCTDITESEKELIIL